MTGRVAAHLSTRRWVGACALAECIGLTSAAGAAKVADAVSPGVLALAAVVVGGLVEGAALGALQGAALGRLVPALDRRRWLLATVVVAGVGWAAASAPSALAPTSSASDGRPPLALVLAGAAGLGAVMGATLGAAQACVLRRRVRHPWRWVLASTAGWPPAMIMIFAGATTPDAGWSITSVLALAVVTGLAAGAVLGLVTGPFLRALDGPAVHDRVVLRVLASPAHRMLGRSLVALRVRGARSGRSYLLPVQYAVCGPGLVVYPARPATKSWWRNLRQPAPVDVLLDGQWQPATGAVLPPDSPGHRAALAAYRSRWPRVPVGEQDPLVRIDLLAARSARGQPQTAPSAAEPTSLTYLPSTPEV